PCGPAGWPGVSRLRPQRAPCSPRTITRKTCSERHWRSNIQLRPFLGRGYLLAYGAWLRRHRRPAESRSPLLAARDTFDALGAAPWSDRARTELAQLVR